MGKKLFRWVQVEPSTFCPFRCVYCPRSCFEGEWVSEHMSMNVFEKLLPSLSNAEYVHLQGWGEPLLHPRIIDMLKLASGVCEAGFTTSGDLLTQGLAREVVASGVSLVAFSVGGAREETHLMIRRGSSLGRVIRGIRMLRDARAALGSARPSIHITFLTTRGNFRELPRLVELARRVGAEAIIVTNLDYVPTEEHERMKTYSCEGENSEAERLIEEAEEKAERLGVKLDARHTRFEEALVCSENPDRCLFVNYRGLVSPCVQLSVPVRGDVVPRVFCGRRLRVSKLFFGDVSTRSLEEIWSSEGYRRFRESFSERRLLQESLWKVKIEPRVDVLEKINKTLREHPLPEPCRTCYKAYGI